MGGVGFGGLVALFLGRLRMNTTQAMEELATIGTETFREGDDIITPEVTIARLRNAVENMLVRHGHSVDMKLRDSSSNRCKVVLFAAPTLVMDHCHPFRSYPSSRISLECTLVDAACATMATPEYFSSVSIGPRLRKQSFAGTPHNLDNPMREVLKEVKLVFGEKSPVSLVLSLGSGQRPRLSDLDLHVTRRSRIHCDDVARDLENQIGGLGGYLRLNVDKGMEKIDLDDWHELGSIETHTEVYLEIKPITEFIDAAAQWLLQRKGSVNLGQLCGASTERGVKFASEALTDYLAMEFKQMHDIVQRCGIAKITLVDAIGNDIPIPTQFCVTYSMLLDVISVYFRHQKAPGSDFVERGDYRLIHGDRRNVMGAIEWAGIEKVGLKVEMSMILRTRNEDKERCPSCRTLFEGQSVDGWAQCLSCTGHFHIETQVQPDTEDQSSDDAAQSNDDPLIEPNGVIPAMNGSKSSEPLMRKRKGSGEAMKLQFRLISVINLLETNAQQYPEPADNATAGVYPATVDYSTPVLEGRLTTALDEDCQVHPTARLLYDSLPQIYRKVFQNCPMYPEKHLEFVKFLKTMSEIDVTQGDANPTLLRPLGIQIPTEEGDKKKWRCPVVGCDFKDTLQHLCTHLQQKRHIDLPMFACRHCKRRYIRANDRNRHEVLTHCNGPSLQTGASRSTRGISHHNAVRQIPTGKTRAGKNLNRPERPSEQDRVAEPPSACIYDADISANGDAPSSSGGDDQFFAISNPWSLPELNVFHPDGNEVHTLDSAYSFGSEGAQTGIHRAQIHGQSLFSLPNHQSLGPASSSNGLRLVTPIQSNNDGETGAHINSIEYPVHSPGRSPQFTGNNLQKQPLPPMQWPTNMIYNPIYSESHNYLQAPALSQTAVYAAPAADAPSRNYYYHPYRRRPTNDTMYDLKQYQTTAVYPNLSI